jgi:hypothetical protein
MGKTSQVVRLLTERASGNGQLDDRADGCAQLLAASDD